MNTAEELFTISKFTETNEKVLAWCSRSQNEHVDVLNLDFAKVEQRYFALVSGDSSKSSKGEE